MAEALGKQRIEAVIAEIKQAIGDHDDAQVYMTKEGAFVSVYGADSWTYEWEISYFPTSYSMWNIKQTRWYEGVYDDASEVVEQITALLDEKD